MKRQAAVPVLRQSHLLILPMSLLRRQDPQLVKKRRRGEINNDYNIFELHFWFSNFYICDVLFTCRGKKESSLSPLSKRMALMESAAVKEGKNRLKLVFCNFSHFRGVSTIVCCAQVTQLSLAAHPFIIHPRFRTSKVIHFLKFWWLFSQISISAVSILLLVA